MTPHGIPIKKEVVVARRFKPPAAVADGKKEEEGEGQGGVWAARRRDAYSEQVTNDSPTKFWYH